VKEYWEDWKQAHRNDWKWLIIFLTALIFSLTVGVVSAGLVHFYALMALPFWLKVMIVVTPQLGSYVVGFFWAKKWVFTRWP
jgi:hypothetical protein